MNIYFAGSIRGGRDDKELYAQIIGLLSAHGNVLTEHVGSATLSDKGEHELTEEFIYKRDMEWLTQADVVVAEVTTPSLGVGYELGKTEDMKKPLLCLFRKQSDRKLSAMVAGNPGIKVELYADINDVKVIFAEFFTSLANSVKQ